MSKNKLTTLILSPYLPHSVDGIITYGEDDKQMFRLSEKDDIDNEVSIYSVITTTYNIQLILKPFEDYSKIVEICDEMTDYEIQMIEDNPDMIKRLTYDVMELMFKHHIDVFGLINKGMAISIHDIF